MNFKLSKFLKDLVGTGLTEIIIVILNIAIFKIIAIALDQEHFGLFMVIRRIIGIALPLLTLNLGIGLVRYVSYQRSDQKIQLSVSLVTIITTTTVALLIFLVGWNHLVSFLKLPDDRQLLLIMWLTILGYAIIDISFAFFRGMQEMKTANTIRILSICFSTLCLCLIWVILSDNYLSIIKYYYFFFSLTAIVLGLYYIKSNINLKAGLMPANYKLTGELFTYSLSRIPAGFLLSLIFSYPVFFVTSKISLVAAGYVGIAITVVRLMETAAAPFYILFLPKFSELQSQKEEKEIEYKIGVVLNFIITLVPLVTVMLYNLSPYIIQILFESKYLGATQSVSVAFLFSSFYVAYALLRGVLDGLYLFPYVTLICVIGFLIVAVMSFLDQPTVLSVTIIMCLGISSMGIISIGLLLKKNVNLIAQFKIKILAPVILINITCFIALYYTDNFISQLAWMHEYVRFIIVVSIRCVLLLIIFFSYLKPHSLWVKELFSRVGLHYAEEKS